MKKEKNVCCLCSERILRATKYMGYCEFCRTMYGKDDKTKKYILFEPIMWLPRNEREAKLQVGIIK